MVAESIEVFFDGQIRLHPETLGSKEIHRASGMHAQDEDDGGWDG
jgi:hypothetical protein